MSYIGAAAFKGCIGLTSIDIPNNVSYIGDEAFYSCSGLTSLTIPNRVDSIGRGAFKGCSGLLSLTIPKSVTYIGGEAFYDTGITSVTMIGETPPAMEALAFYNPRQMRLYVPAGARICFQYHPQWGKFERILELYNGEVLPDYRETGLEFKVVDDLHSFGGFEQELPDPKEKMLQVVREENTYTGAITIPEFVNYKGDVCMVTSIGSNVFGSGLTSIFIPKSVSYICPGWGGYQDDSEGAFYGCSDLASIVVAEDNKVYDSQNNCNAIIETKKNSLIVGCKNTVIPNGVTSIGDMAFMNCSGLTSITIPNSVTSIGIAAFQGCSSLTSVIIPNGVTELEVDVFSGCSSLTSITIPNSVTSIQPRAFDGCSRLTSITIPNSVTYIGEYAFAALGLTSITIPNSVTYFDMDVFAGCSRLTSIKMLSKEPPSIVDWREGQELLDDYSKVTLYVPEGAIRAYRNHPVWGKIKVIK